MGRSVAIFALVICLANGFTIFYDRMIVEPLDSNYKVREQVYFSYLSNQSIFQQAEVIQELTVTGSFQTNLIERMTSFLSRMDGNQKVEFSELVAVLALDRARRISVAKLYAQVAYSSDPSSYEEFVQRIDGYRIDEPIYAPSDLLADKSAEKVSNVILQMRAAAQAELDSQRSELSQLESSIQTVSLLSDVVKYAVVVVGIIGSIFGFFLTIRKQRAQET